MTSYLDEMLAGSKPTLLEFYATWNTLSNEMMPIVAQLIDIEGKRANIVQFEGDQNGALVEKYGITAYPSWLLFKEGKEVWRATGELTLAQLRDAIAPYV